MTAFVGLSVTVGMVAAAAGLVAAVSVTGVLAFLGANAVSLLVGIALHLLLVPPRLLGVVVRLVTLLVPPVAPLVVLWVSLVLLLHFESLRCFY